MTRHNKSILTKQAKESALDKAMAAAAKAGKPTTAGIMAGGGLGAILAAAGALHRSEQDPSERSILTNPLLLGALGATGGYLAGNAFEQVPVDTRHELSGSAATGLLGGTGILGTMLAKDDARRELKSARRTFSDADTAVALAQSRIRKMKRPSRAAVEKLRAAEAKLSKARSAYAQSLLRSGDEAAATALGYKVPETVRGQAWQKIRHSAYSPLNWARSLNPFKNLKITEGLNGPALLKNQLSHLIGFGGRKPKSFGNALSRLWQQSTKLRGNRRVPARLAALALLAGGGKAVYDYTHS